MTPERWMRVREVFEAALDEPPERRSAFVADACAGDAALEAEARALLASAGEAGSFLERGVRLGDTEVSAAGPPPPPSRAIGTTIAGFRILRLLREGGMGIVYEAQQERPHRLVALKVVRGGISDPHRLRLFEREVEALAR